MTLVTPINLLTAEQKHEALVYAVGLLTKEQFDNLREFINKLHEGTASKSGLIQIRRP